MNLNTNKFFNSTEVHISSRMNEYLKKNFGYEVEGDFDKLHEAKKVLEAEKVELKKLGYMNKQYVENMLMIETITSLLKAHGEDTSSSHSQEEVNEEEKVTDGTREELTRLIQPGEYLNFPSNPSAADFLGDMKIILKQVFSSQGTKVPEEIADLYNKLLAYHKDKELQAKNRKIPSDNSNHAPYYPENMDEEYVASFADPFYDAFRSTADALGIDLEEAKEERVDEIVPLVIGGLARAAVGAVAKKAAGAVGGAMSNAVSNANSVNASKKSKSKKLNAVKEDEEEKGPDHYRWKNDSQLSIAKDRLEASMKQLEHAIEYRSKNSHLLMRGGDKAGTGDLYNLHGKLKDVLDNWDENTEYYGM